MSNLQTNQQAKAPGFWKRLVLAVEAMGDSYEEQLEKRVRTLEVAVARLTQARQKGD